MKKTITILMITVSLMLNSVYANDINSTTPIAVEQNASMDVSSVNEEQPSRWSRHSFGEKVAIVVAAPIVAAGYIVTAVVVAPVYIIKKIFN